MDKSAAERIAQRFVGLPVEQRRQILAKMHETGQSFKLLPIAVTRHAAARIPLSYAQQRMLFLWQMEPGNAAYNVPMAVRLNGALDRQALSAALDLLVQRHETLRTRFVSEDGAFSQEILDQATVALEFASVAPADIEQQVRAELQKPFDLLSGTLLRVKLFQLSESEHVLTVCMHHVVSDGWSGEVLIREFVQLYQAQVSGAASAVACAGDSVRRLRDLATRLAGGRGGRAAVALLETATGQRTSVAEPATGSSASAATQPSRCECARRPVAATLRATEKPGAQQRPDPVHGDTGGAVGGTVALQRTVRPPASAHPMPGAHAASWKG